MASLKHTVIIAVFVALLAASFPGVLPAQKAKAIFGIGDIVFDPTNWVETVAQTSADTATAVSSAATAATTGSLLAQNLFEWAQDFVLAVLKRQILDVMVDQVVTWIQGGGEPKFITDWESFLGDIGQRAVGEFVEQIGAGFLCEPFSLQVRLNLLPVQRFGGAATGCTLDQIVANIDNFYNDFRNGGWIAYNANWEPQNNYYGALLIAWDARNNYVADKLAAETNKALANKGFLGTKRCWDIDTGAEVPEGSKFSKCEDTTPGGIVSSALEKAVGSDFEFIVNAQQLGDYAAAIVNALVNRIIIEGVNGLRGVTRSGSSQPSRPPISGGFRTTSDIPSNLRGAIADHSNSAQGAFSNASRADVTEQLRVALQTRTIARAAFATPANTSANYLRLVDDALACHATVATLRSGIIHQTVVDKRPLAQNLSDLARIPAERNIAALNDVQRALTTLNALTDAQYRERAAEFQTIFVQSDPALISQLTNQARSLGEQINASITSDTLADIQRDINYCVSQGGTAPNRPVVPPQFVEEE